MKLSALSITNKVVKKIQGECPSEKKNSEKTMGGACIYHSAHTKGYNKPSPFEIVFFQVVNLPKQIHEGGDLF